MEEDLFKTFSPVSIEQWKEKITTDLKGKDYNETLVWNSEIGPIDPLSMKTPEGNPILKGSNLWSISQRFSSKAKHANKHILEALAGGCNSLELTAVNLSNYEQTLQGVDLSIIDLHVHANEDNIEDVKKVMTILQGKYDLTGGIFYDPISYNNTHFDKVIALSKAF